MTLSRPHAFGVMCCQCVSTCEARDIRMVEQLPGMNLIVRVVEGRRTPSPTCAADSARRCDLKIERRRVARTLIVYQTQNMRTPQLTQGYFAGLAQTGRQPLATTKM